ncbi:MAG: hypothetical protein A2469_01695 [Candidatus Magasanikbacteria bacterium RIFOXYC2_FULL_40_16]|uniref:Uncharacterized protein n=2 Tax=Candidatus Magasanikiibacteriota TaxID=1752731 RepID=A0A1F6NZQ5_9BACT|nr:MAG: hypothetical protein A2206_02900 [Candidatus Magasanikbacteria bacterium RIFOXYA1_FULL_40_8]OGH89310.1 MAG: hypothetical protein A2469_01695 [Candidatus Magasanikbacteria bacterium RIFOXYC2_FULL_40_16]
MKIRFISWDWKEQIELEFLNKALQEVFNSKNAPCVTQILDTGGDSYAVVVSGEVIDEKQAQKIYDRYNLLPIGKNPYVKVLDIKCPE